MKPIEDFVNKVRCGDCVQIMKELPPESVDLVLTSPPYSFGMDWGLRDYGLEAVSDWGDWKGQLGLEPHPGMFITHLVSVCRELKRVLKRTGSFYLNLGDTYCGSHCGAQHGWADKKREKVKGIMKQESPQANLNDGAWLQPKQLMLIPSRVAIALQHDGWILRNDIVWHKANHMPSSVRDRLTNSWEHLFHFVKARRYFYDLDAIRKPHKTNLPLASKGAFHDHQKDLEVGQRIQLKANNPKGKNPADVYQGKFDGYGEESEKFGSPRARTQRKHNLHPAFRGNNFGISIPPEAGHPLGKNPSDFWSINTKPFPRAHFATFPPALCEMPIKAACPMWICRKCGKPRTRIVDSSEKINTQWGIRQKESVHEGYGKIIKTPIHKTVGFTDCGCQKGFRPGVVLDPFCGAGTTLVTAHKLCRHWIGIDIVPSYVEMAKERLKRECSQKLAKFAEAGS